MAYLVASTTSGPILQISNPWWLDTINFRLINVQYREVHSTTKVRKDRKIEENKVPLVVIVDFAILLLCLSWAILWHTDVPHPVSLHTWISDWIRSKSSRLYLLLLRLVERMLILGPYQGWLLFPAYISIFSVTLGFRGLTYCCLLTSWMTCLGILLTRKFVLLNVASFTGAK